MATRKATAARALMASTTGDDGALADPAPAPPAPPPAPEAAAPAAHPPITAYRDVWVHNAKVALANNQVGFLTVLATDAQTMIANGDAVDPYTTDLPYISESVVVAITAFSAANPTVATASASQVSKLRAGDTVHVVQTGGANIPTLNGRVTTVASPSGTTFTLVGVDLSAANVTGVTANATLR